MSDPHALVPDRALGSRGSRAAIEPCAGPADLAGRPVVVATVQEWWRRRAAAAGLDARWGDPMWAIVGSVPASLAEVDEAPDEDILDAPGEDLGELYVGAVPAATRGAHGRHYTPASIAAHLWNQVRATLELGDQPTSLPGLVVDPACGAGALLLPALREHLAASAHVQPELVLRALPGLIAGTDLDPFAVWVANVALAAELLPLLAQIPPDRRVRLPEFCRVADGLAADAHDATIVVMNPPYGRVRLGEPERARFAHALYGHANLYGLFMAAGIERLHPEGVLAALVPSSFLGGAYFQNLRAHLATTAPLARLSFVGERTGVFSTGVLQETCIATFQRSPRDTVALDRVDNGNSGPVGNVERPVGQGPWLLPRTQDQQDLTAAALKLPDRLASYGWRVSTGPLVWNRHKAQLRSRAGAGNVKVVWAADLRDGAVQPHAARDHQRYLRPRGQDDAWLIRDRPAVLVQRTTAPEQARRLVVGVLDASTIADWGGQVIVENHLNVLTPPQPAGPLTAELLSALLSSDTVDQLYRCITGSVAVSAYELLALPLPPPRALAELQQLVEQPEAFEAAVACAYRGRP